jgi:hypothetical protein
VSLGLDAAPSADDGLPFRAPWLPIERLHLARQDRTINAVDSGDHLERMPLGLVDIGQQTPQTVWPLYFAGLITKA